jgi:hypothetical protein
MAPDAEDFVRRFRLHVLPKGFVRIRHYGVLAGHNVDTKLAECRKLLGAAVGHLPPIPLQEPNQRPPAAMPLASSVPNLRAVGHRCDVGRCSPRT